MLGSQPALQGIRFLRYQGTAGATHSCQAEHQQRRQIHSASVPPLMRTAQCRCRLPQSVLAQERHEPGRDSPVSKPARRAHQKIDVSDGKRKQPIASARDVCGIVDVSPLCPGRNKGSDCTSRDCPPVRSAGTLRTIDIGNPNMSLCPYCAPRTRGPRDSNPPLPAAGSPQEKRPGRQLK
jgi:hypothetical protein